MPTKLSHVTKIKAAANASTLELSVTKTGGPVATVVEVASSGTDDERFTNAQLTPGPAVKALKPANTYTLVWTGAFVRAGTVTLKARQFDAEGNVLLSRTVPIKGKAGDKFVRVVLLR